MREVLHRSVSVIGEIGSNHCQIYDKAVALVKGIKKAGADAVKVSMFTPDGLTLKTNHKRFTITKGKWKGSLWDLYQKTAMPYEWIPHLKALADHLGIKFIVSVYHPDTVDITEEMGIEIYKIASFEIDYDDLLIRVAKTGKPVIISTGGAKFDEVWKAFRFMTGPVALLHCVSAYPSMARHMNLRTILELGRYAQPGLSDHSRGLTVPIAASALGAEIIEKHIKLDDKGMDAEFSLDLRGFRAMINAVRIAKASVGHIKFGYKKTYHRRLVDDKFVRTVY